MAFPTAVNSQITDSITQSNLSVVGSAPGQALGTLYQTIAATAGLSAQNAVAQQQNGTVLAEAVTSQAVKSLLNS